MDFSGWRERLKHNNGSVGTMDIASCKPDVKSSRSGLLCTHTSMYTHTHDISSVLLPVGKTDRGVLTIGMIGMNYVDPMLSVTCLSCDFVQSGYPNAGKSSIINGILNEKVVSCFHPTQCVRSSIYVPIPHSLSR